MLLIVVLFFILPFILMNLRSLKRRYDIAQRLPGPPSWPIIGTPSIKNATPQEFFNIMLDYEKKYGKSYKMWQGTELSVFTSDTKLVAILLNKDHLTKAVGYECLKPWLGTGLLTSAGKLWHQRRKALTPALHFKILEDHVKIFEKQANFLIEILRKDEVIDVTQIFPMITLDSICQSSMGIDLNTRNGFENDYVQSMQTVSNISFKRMLNPFLWNDLAFYATNSSKSFNENLKFVNERTMRVIANRRAFLESNANIGDAPCHDELGRKKKICLIDVLLTTEIEGKPLSDTDIQDEVNTFILAGYETTSIAAASLLYHIAKYPEVQQKLVYEIQGQFNKDENMEYTIAALNKLHYLDLVIKESLRHHTPVPMVGRRIFKDTEIGGYLFPENTSISFNVYGLCHSPEYFQDPEKFWPERFEIEKIDDIVAHLPFSAGPRICIGKRFAFLELKMIAAKVLLNYQIELAKPDFEVTLAFGIMLQVVNGIPLRFKQRIK